MAIYYEGYCLSLLLDNMHDPVVWKELAARRWCALNQVKEGVQWDVARALLPMSSNAGVPTSILFEQQKFAKAQRELNPRLSPSLNSNRGQRGERRAAGKGRDSSGGNNSTVSGDGGGAAATGGRNAGQRRG